MMWIFTANAFCYIQIRYFICRWMMHQSCSIFQYLVVNYHLVVSYPQQCHIRINENKWYVVITAINTILLFCIFSCGTLNNFYKLLVIVAPCNENKWIVLISKIMSKHYGICTENCTIFFSNAGKTRNVEMI